MWSRGGRSSALDRAKAQLSGLRLSELSEKKRDGHFGAVEPQARQTRFLDLSDVSSTSQPKNHEDLHDPAQKASENFTMGGGSRFLKKTSKGGLSASKGTDKSELEHQRHSQSSALNRLSLIENRIRNQTGKRDGPGIQTDLPEPQETHSSLQSSSDLSMTGSRFLKKHIVSAPEEQKVPQKTTLNTVVPALTERKERRFSLDSDEQDMRIILGDSFSLSEDTMRNVRQRSPQALNKFYRKGSKTSTVSSSTPDRHKPQNQVLHSHSQSSPSPPPSFIRPDSRRVVFTGRSVSSESDQSEIRSLDDLFAVAASPGLDDILSERSAASDDFKLHVMTLDTLVPVFSEKAEISQEKTEAKDRKDVNIRKAADSLATAEERSAAYESDFESEIRSEGPPSASEISEHLTDEDKEEAQYSSYKSQDEDLSSSECGDASSRSGSSDATVTRSSGPVRLLKEAAVQTHTDGLTYTWTSGMAAVGPSLGMTYVDPTPIASYTVSAEALESVTSYSPAVVALNDMFRQQLSLTRAFIEASRHQYTSALESLGRADYRYTTLEDTKEFIRTHRPPTLSFEEALEEVLQDMRDYHYI